MKDKRAPTTSTGGMPMLLVFLNISQLSNGLKRLVIILSDDLMLGTESLRLHTLTSELLEPASPNTGKLILMIL